ncbi:MAG: DHA2 family efflux MFS transporter permease subunit [Burkholderiales bacterium]
MAQQAEFAEHHAPLLLTLVLAMANFMQVLDLTIANVSLPAITGDLGAAPSQGAWVITSYAVASAISVPLTGWLSDRFGQVRLFTAVTALFTAASFLCGISWSMPVLIAARVLQGAVAGVMVPLSQALLINSYPPEKRGMALAIWSMTITVAPIVGPILGGWITDNTHWSWIFFINVPVGALAAFGTWELLKHRETPIRKLKLDYVGLLLLVVWVGCLQVLLDKGNELDWFNSNFIVTLSILAALCFALFMAWELTERHPVVDLSLFKHRNFRMGVLSLSLAYAVFLAMNVVQPLWLQTQMGYTAQWAGYVVAPSGILAVLFAPIVGKALRRVDPRLFASAAFLIFSALCFLRSHFTTSADFFTFALPQFIQGAAVAMFFAPVVSINLGGLPASLVASASGIQNFLRALAGSFGVSLAITYWDRREVLHRSQLVEHITASSPAAADYAARLGALGLPPEQVPGVIDRVVTGQAFMLATNDIFIVCGWLLLALVGLVWLARPPFGIGGPVAAD